MESCGRPRYCVLVWKSHSFAQENVTAKIAKNTLRTQSKPQLLHDDVKQLAGDVDHLYYLLSGRGSFHLLVS